MTPNLIRILVGLFLFSTPSFSNAADWYTYKSGNWTDPDNWTTDPSGTLRINPSSLYPNLGTDDVYILNGDVMLMNTNGISIASITINNGGVLNLAQSNSHSFTTINGSGKIQIAGDALPSGDYSSFSSISGGTIEFIDQSPAADYAIETVNTFNNMTINLASNKVVQMADLTLNGNLTINSGSYQINDNTSDGFTDNTTPLNLLVRGDITVNGGASMEVGDVDASTAIGAFGIYSFHQLDLKGNFTNNGTVTFTNLSGTSIADQRNLDKYPTASDNDNLASPVIPTSEYGVVEVLLTNSWQDQYITCNGPTDFYRIEISKGTSQTYFAEITASSTSNFRLLGRVAMGQSDDSSDSPGIDNDRALGLEAGILKLGSNIELSAIAKDDTNGTQARTQGTSSNFVIDDDAQLWLANNSSITKSLATGCQVLGKLKITDDATYTFSGTGERSILLDNEGSFEMTGGTVNLTQFRNLLGTTTPRGSFVMTGGTLNIGGGDADANHALFSLPWNDQIFILSAANQADPPVINIALDADSRGKDNTVIQIGVAAGNYNVGTSDINIIKSVNTDYKVISTAPLYNLEITDSGTGEIIIDNTPDSNGDYIAGGGLPSTDESGTVGSPAEDARALTILNNLIISDGRFDANDQNITIGNLLTVSNGAEYDPGTNATILSGSSSMQSISLNGTTPIVGGGFYDLTFSTSGTTKNLSGDLATYVVLNDFTIGSGVTFNDAGKTLQVNGNLSNSGTHTTDADAPGKVEITGGSAAHELGGNGNGTFKILTIDDATFDVICTADQQIDSVLNLVNGILDIDVYQLTLNSTATNPIVDDASGVSNFNNTRYIRTAGNASDDGIHYYIQADKDDYLFPMGTDRETGTDKYTPAIMSITGTSASNAGYIKISVADQFLPTIDPSETAKLDYYWRVNHSGFTTIPNVSFAFYYNDEDITGNENNYNAGYVLDEIPFTREEQDANDDDRNTNELIFNGTSNNGAFPGNRYSLINANYSAAGSNAWNGAPEIYYTRWYNANGAAVDWENTSYWTLATNDIDGNGSVDADEVHDSRQPQASDYPQAGDIAVIGWVPHNDPNLSADAGKPHGIKMDNPYDLAQLVFTPMEDASGNPVARNYATNFQFRPTVVINPGADANAGIISGEGNFWVRSTSSTISDPDWSDSDLGLFVTEDSSYFTYEFYNSYVYSNIPTEVPNLLFTSNGWGSNDVKLFLTTGFTTNGNLEILGDGNLVLSSVANGDLIINKDLRLFRSNVNGNESGGGAELLYPNDYTRSVEVYGDVSLEYDGMFIGVDGPENTTQNIHSLIVHGDIIQDTDNGGGAADDGLQLYTADGFDYIELHLTGNGNHSYTKVDGDVANLGTIVIDKGIDVTSSFAFDADFNLLGDNSSVTKALDIQNGEAIINESNIDIELNTGGGDFKIPGSGGLTLNAGTARISATGSGSGNGLRLEGALSINGGNLILNGGASADNYIEYGSGGSASVEITSGNLIVGSQFRRSLYADDGIIQYNQTGGSAVFGINSTPENSKGVFEIVNSGAAGTSSFELSGASTTFALVGAQDSPEQGTLILDSDINSNFSADAIIDFGYNGTVAGVTVQNATNESFEINSGVTLPNLRIDNGNLNSPTIELIQQSITVNGDVSILNGGSLVSNGFDLSLSGDFINDGIYTPGTNTTIFNGDAQNISGTSSTSFNFLSANSSTSLTLQNTITVADDLLINSGILDDNGNAISLEGNLYITTEHVSDGSGGLHFDASASEQFIYLPDYSAEIDLLYVNNPNGVTLDEVGAVASSLTIDQELALDAGLFKIEDNRLVLDSDATVTTSSTFGTSRMISINGVKKSDGVEKEFAAGVDAAAFIIPVGTPDKYTPVTLDVDNSDDPGSILVKPINSIHPSATGPDALNYYWLISTNPFTVANFIGSISFQYEEADANNAGQNESTWENKAARLITPSWLKPSTNLVDISNNVMTFTNSDLSSGGLTTFDGEFTIGNDLPDNLAQFTSAATGSWNVGTNWNVDRDADDIFNEAVDDAPLSIIPQPGSIVVVQSGHEVTMSNATDNNQNIFSIEIIGTLNVADSDGHNFGEISGSGTLKTHSSTLPGGDYDAFFTTTDGALELAGSGSYTISPDFTAIRSLTVSGGGTKTLPSFALSIGADGLVIDESTTLDNSVNNNIISISGDANLVDGTLNLGNASASLAAQNFIQTTGTFNSAGAVLDLSSSLTINGGTFNAGSGTHTIGGNMLLNAAATFNNNNGTFTFDGSTNQSLAGDFSSETFNNLSLNKSAGSLNLASNANVVISNTLTLDGGNINSQATGATLRMTNGVGSITQNSGFVSGPLQVDLNDGDDFSFPVGKGSSLKPLAISIQNGSQSANPLTWEVEYYNSNPSGYSSAENTGIDINLIETNTNPDEQVVNVYGIEYWRIDTQTGTAVTDQISLDISNTGLTTDQINDELIQVMTWNNTNGEWDHLGGTSTGTPTSANVTSTSTLSFSEKILTSGSEDPSALPVELIDFSADLLDGIVEIKWSTASEIDNDYFVIERSSDGKIFEVLGEVAGFGTTNEKQIYEFIDERPYFGIAYYRLVQVDFDGTESIFGPISVNNDQFRKGIDLVLYPNPTETGEFNLKINSGDENSPIQIAIFDLSGQLIYSNGYDAQLGTQIIAINLNTRPGPGIYHIKVQQGFNQTIQILIVR